MGRAAELRAYACEAATRAGIDPATFERQINAESGFDPDAHNAGSNADGIAQIVVRFHPEMAGRTRDPYVSLDYAAKLMRSHLAARGGDWALALSNYNAGPGATTQGLKGQLDGWPYAETVRYVANILQISQDEARRRLRGETTVALKLSDVLARAYSQVTNPPKPYVWGGKTPASSFDCSGFVAWAYNGAVPSFTDAIYAPTERVAKPSPGDIVLYQYADADQPGVRFPHVGLFISDTETLDARGGVGVGVHPQLSRSYASRFYRRLPGVVADTDISTPPPPPPPPVATDAEQETIKGLRTAVAHLADVVVPKAAAAAQQRDEAIAEAKAIREQFVGPRP